jgi:acetyltransferase-like isoleucine patch superfamily enzyme
VSGRIVIQLWGWGNTPIRLRIGEGAIVEPGVVFRLTDGADVTIGPLSLIRRGVVLNASGTLTLVRQNMISWYSTIHCAGSVVLGDQTGLSEQATIVDSTHYRTTPDKYGYENTLISHVAIGDRCWIAAKAAVLHGVEIGDDVVVAAGSVVTKNLPVGVLAGGIPARVLAENYSGAPGS